jgi:hypothetical protein
MLTTNLAKAGWEVGALSFGLPRRPHGLAGALETTLMAAVVVAKQNFLEVYDASSAEEMGLSSCRALTTLLQTRRYKKEDRMGGDGSNLGRHIYFH